MLEGKIRLRRIIIFGASEGGRRALSNLSESDLVLAYCDNAEHMWGKTIYGHKILPPSDIFKLDFDIVLIASIYWQEIKKQLLSLGLEQNSIIIDKGILAQSAVPCRKYYNRPKILRLERRPRDPIRIAYVLKEYPVLSQTFVTDEIGFIKKQGAYAHVFAHRTGNEKGDKKFDIPFSRFDDLNNLLLKLAKFKADFVHTHFIDLHVLKFLLPACENLSLPFSIKPHAYDIFRSKNISNRELATVGKSPNCRFVLALGRFHQDYFLRHGVPPEKIKLVRNIVDLSLFKSDCFLLKPYVKKVLTIARFVEKKGLDLLIRSFRLLNDASLELNIVGYGPIAKELKEMAKFDNRVHFSKGPTDRAKIAKLLRDADLFVLPCRIDDHGDSDGLPTVLLEAMSAGVPVLTTPIASITDLVRHGETGWLVSPGTLDSLIDGLKSAIRSTLEERRLMIRRARSIIHKEFDPNQNAKLLTGIWRSAFDHD